MDMKKFAFAVMLLLCVACASSDAQAPEDLTPAPAPDTPESASSWKLTDIATFFLHYSPYIVKLKKDAQPWIDRIYRDCKQTTLNKYSCILGIGAVSTHGAWLAYHKLLKTDSSSEADQASSESEITDGDSNSREDEQVRWQTHPSIVISQEREQKALEAEKVIKANEKNEKAELAKSKLKAEKVTKANEKDEKAELAKSKLKAEKVTKANEKNEKAELAKSKLKAEKVTKAKKAGIFGFTATVWMYGILSLLFASFGIYASANAFLKTGAFVAVYGLHGIISLVVSVTFAFLAVLEWVLLKTIGCGLWESANKILEYGNIMKKQIDTLSEIVGIDLWWHLLLILTLSLIYCLIYDSVARIFKKKEHTEDHEGINVSESDASKSDNTDAEQYTDIEAFHEKPSDAKSSNNERRARAMERLRKQLKR